MKEQFEIFISLNIVPRAPIDKMSTLGQAMAGTYTDDKPLF